MNALLTDLYELQMAASYLRRGMDGRGTFSLFVRALPPNRGFLVAAGLESCIDYLETLRFEVEDLRYLRDTLGFTAKDAEAFRRLRFTGDVWAVPEGRIVFGGEPLVEVTAPLAEAELIETFLLNRITFETTIASKAARCVIAARGRRLIDFAMRRTQGIEASLDVARLSAMVGFAATSNVEAARRYGLEATGTMAHSYIQAFKSEREAFAAFAQDYPKRATFLVDTYDTIQGVREAIAVIKDNNLGGDLGIRIDSGDLARDSRRARQLLDNAGLMQVRVIASGGLDEFQVDELTSGGAPIDAFGVGTRMGVSADQPYLDTAYKLISLGGRPVMKLSRGKATQPGPKQVFRRPVPLRDVVGLRVERAPAGYRALLRPVMRDGRRLAPRADLSESRRRFVADLALLPPGALSMRSPVPPVVGVTPALRHRTEATRRSLVQKRTSR